MAFWVPVFWVVFKAVFMYGVSRLFAGHGMKPSPDSSTQTVGQQTTEAQGGAIPVSYGTNRVHANIVAHYTEVAVTTKDVDNIFLPDITYVAKTEVTRNILACFGEGPIPEPDTDTVRINGRPLSDFPGMTCEIKRGLIDQTVPTDWSTFRQDFGVGATCMYNEPVTWEAAKGGWDELEIHVAWPQGVVKYGESGSTYYTVSLKIEVGDQVADSWQTIFEDAITVKTASYTRLAFLASNTYTGGSPFTVTDDMVPRVRVTKTSWRENDDTHITGTEFACVQLHRSIGFTHPGMVMMALSGVPDELTSGGITELSMITDGRIVDDGASSFGTSQYHADAIRDILTQPVIEGDGSGGDPYTVNFYRGLDISRIIEAGFTAQKTLADYAAADGAGGTEDLLHCDIVLSSTQSVHAAVRDVCASGRCGLLPIGQYFGLWVDSPRTPVGLLCDGNVERDSIQPDPAGIDDLPSEASVQYRDASASYRDRTILVTDTESDSLEAVSISLPAVTRTSEAARLARRELARARLSDLGYQCRADIDAIVYEPGDVVYGQIDGRSIGGRIVAVDGRTVTADRDIDEVLTGTDVLVVQVRDSGTGVQSVEMHDVSSVSGREITIDEDFTGTPIAGDPFLFGTEDIADDQFEIVDTNLDESLHATLVLQRYVPALDALDDVDPETAIPISSMTTGNPYGSVARKVVSPTTLSALAGTALNLTGDGVTDETAALQQLIDDAIDGAERELVLPQGTYLITSTLEIGDGTAVIPGLTIRCAAWEHAKLLWGGSGTDNMIELTSCNGLVLDSLSIDGGNIAGTTGIYHTTGASAASQHTTLRNCQILNCPAVGYHVKQWSPTAACDYLVFENCQIAYNGTGLKVEGGVRQIDLLGGSVLVSTSFGVHIVDGVVHFYDTTFGLNGPGYSTGSATFTNGSATVTGSGTSWTSAMEGCPIRLDADATWYEVDTVASATSLTLTASYTDTGGSGAYMIAPHPDTADIYIEGPVAAFHVHGGTTESLKFLRGDWASDAGWSGLVTQNIVIGLNQAANDAAGGASAVDVVIDYDCPKPLHLIGCKLMGDVELGSKCATVWDHQTDFWNWERLPTDDNPLTGFTGTTSVVNHLGYTDPTINPRQIVNSVKLGNGRVIIAADTWLNGIDLLDTSGAVYKRIGFADAAPSTPYASHGWWLWNMTPGLSEPIGWFCTASGDPGVPTNATFVQFGQNLLGATITDFARASIFTCEDGDDLIDAAGLGTMASQDADNVAITGGSITGITELDIAYGGTGASTAAAARTNLGIQTMVDDSPTAKTADYTIQSTDVGRHFTNSGAAGTVHLTLPAAVVGMVFAASRVASQTFTLKPATGEQFADQTANDYLDLSSNASTAVVKCLTTGVWHIVAQFGSYTFVTP